MISDVCRAPLDRPSCGLGMSHNRQPCCYLVASAAGVFVYSISVAGEGEDDTLEGFFGSVNDQVQDGARIQRGA